MSKKQTNLYKATLSMNGQSVGIYYFYGRNADSVKRYIKDNINLKHDNVYVLQIGINKQVMSSPVVPFNEEEIDAIERHFTNEALKIAGVQAAQQLASEGVHV